MFADQVMKKLRLGYLAALFLVSCCCLVTISMRLGHAKSSLCRDEDLTGSLSHQQLIWKVAVDNGIAYPPLVSGQVVILVDRKDKTWRTNDSDVVYAFERSSGILLWRYPVESTTGYIVVIKGSSRYVALSIRNNPA